MGERREENARLGMEAAGMAGIAALVGYTGFVGSNLWATGAFNRGYNSQNIREADGTRPDLLVYAGLRAEKYLANQAPEKDLALIQEAEENIRRMDPRRLVLISTIDVFKTPKGVDEGSEIETEGLHPYGHDRYLLEKWVRERYPEALIVRLPGLFGRNIKKNFIYDYLNVIPFMLKEEKLLELATREPGLKENYTLQENGFYRLEAKDSREELKGMFRRAGFSALNFTDSRSRYQFYDLSRLWQDIQTALGAGLRIWHPATEPISAGELYHYLTGEDFVNELPGSPADYDYRTRHAELFGGRDGYISDKKQVMQQIKDFVAEAGN